MYSLVKYIKYYGKNIISLGGKIKRQRQRPKNDYETNYDGRWKWSREETLQGARYLFQQLADRQNVEKWKKSKQETLNSIKQSGN